MGPSARRKIADVNSQDVSCVHATLNNIQLLRERIEDLRMFNYLYLSYAKVALADSLLSGTAKYSNAYRS